MYEIRRYQNCDAADVRTVCLSTSNIRICRKKIIKNALINVFCNYYIEQEPQNCYVAADEKGQVIGYILCAINFDVWKENFRETYLKKSNNPVTRLMEMCIRDSHYLPGKEEQPGQGVLYLSGTEESDV